MPRAGKNRSLVASIGRCGPGRVYVEKYMLAHHFSHYYSQRCQWMVFKLAGAIGPSCHDHTKISVRFRLWNCWGLCWEIDVGPSLFTSLQLKMPTNGVRTDRCDQPLMPGSHQTFYLVPVVVKLLGTVLRNGCWPITFHICYNRRCQWMVSNWPVWSAPHAPITPNFPSGSDYETVGDCVEN